MHLGQLVDDRYTVEGRLGEGGTATVYRIEHIALGSKHALKVIDGATARMRQRLMREGRVQARLRHPNLVPVTDVILVDGDPGLVADYVHGPDLAEWIARHSPNWRTALEVFQGIVEGVAHAHRAGAIHRDLKPANVLIATEPHGARPMITDFGLVKLLAGDGGMTMTRSGCFMGTPGYASPEQCLSASKVDQRTDMFSLGCLLYELVCHRPAFDGADQFSMVQRSATRGYVPPEAIQPNLPRYLVDIIHDLLDPNVATRVQSCQQLLHRLEANEPGKSGVHTDAPVFKPPARPRRSRWTDIAWMMPVAAAAALAVVLVA